MKAEQLIKILETFPDAEIRIWNNTEIQVEISESDDKLIINITRK